MSAVAVQGEEGNKNSAAGTDARARTHPGPPRVHDMRFTPNRCNPCCPSILLLRTSMFFTVTTCTAPNECLRVMMNADGGEDRAASPPVDITQQFYEGMAATPEAPHSRNPEAPHPSRSAARNIRCVISGDICALWAHPWPANVHGHLGCIWNNPPS